MKKKNLLIAASVVQAEAISSRRTSFKSRVPIVQHQYSYNNNLISGYRATS